MNVKVTQRATLLSAWDPEQTNRPDAVAIDGQLWRTSGYSLTGNEMSISCQLVTPGHSDDDGHWRTIVVDLPGGATGSSTSFWNPGGAR